MDPPPTTPTLTTPQPQPTLPPPQPQPQPQDSTTTTTTPTTTNHPQTPFQTQPKLRLMCSYNGHIIPRPNTKLLCYVGGDTRMISLDRTATISELLTRLSTTIKLSTPFSIKYQLPGEDLDSLISLSTDEDLDNMVDEYDRLISVTKPGRIRLFLFPPSQSMGPPSSVVDGSDDWFLNAINGTGYSDPGTGTGPITDCLIGLDHELSVKEEKVVVEKVVIGQDVQSVPDSKTSSFGSTSSTPTTLGTIGTMGNGGSLPMIKVHGNGNGGGIEEQFGGISVGNNDGQKGVMVDEGFGVVLTSSQPMINGFSGGEYANRVYLEDVKQYPVNSGQQLGVKSQLGTDLPSPDSVSSDNSLSGAIPRQKPVVYQDPSGQLSSGSTRFPSGIQAQQVSESGYPLHPQYDPHQQIIFQPHQQQLHQQQNFVPQQPQNQPQTQQQYMPAGPHFVHHPPPGAVPMPMPMPGYYPIYPPQQPSHHPHHYPVYYLPAPGYSLPGQQQPIPAEAPTSIPSTRTQLAPPNPTIITTSNYNPPGNINMEPPKSEMGPGTPQLVQVPSSMNQSSSQPQPQPQPQLQHQFMGYSQIHHSSPGVAPNSGAVPSYAYEYYTQPQTPTLSSQYQGVVSSGPTMMMAEVAPHLSNDSVKQQTRSSQPL